MRGEDPKQPPPCCPATVSLHLFFLSLLDFLCSVFIAYVCFLTRLSGPVPGVAGCGDGDCGSFKPVDELGESLVLFIQIVESVLFSCRRRLGPHVCLSGFGSGCCPGWAPSMGSGHCTLRKYPSIPVTQAFSAHTSAVHCQYGLPHLYLSSQPSAPLAVGVASASPPMSAPARMESKGPLAQVTGMDNG